MPVYIHHCSDCGEMELFRHMKDATPKKCPQCGRVGLEQIFSANFIPPCDSQQENLNGGMGEFYPQLGPQFLDAKTKTKRNPNSHARSRADAIDKFKRKGCTVEKT